MIMYSFIYDGEYLCVQKVDIENHHWKALMLGYKGISFFDQPRNTPICMFYWRETYPRCSSIVGQEADGPSVFLTAVSLESHEVLVAVQSRQSRDRLAVFPGEYRRAGPPILESIDAHLCNHAWNAMMFIPTGHTVGRYHVGWCYDWLTLAINWSVCKRWTRRTGTEFVKHQPFDKFATTECGQTELGGSLQYQHINI